MENAIELKDIYKDVVRNGNDVAELWDFINENFDMINKNTETFTRRIDEIAEVCINLSDKHKVVIFGGLVLCGRLFVLSTRIKRQNVKIKALELRVESLEKRRNLHVCSGDCHTEE